MRLLFGPLSRDSDQNYWLGELAADSVEPTEIEGEEAQLMLKVSEVKPSQLVLALNIDNLSSKPQTILHLVGIADHWSQQWHAYRRLLRSCALVFIDKDGAAACAREGIGSHCIPGPLPRENRELWKLVQKNAAEISHALSEMEKNGTLPCQFDLLLRTWLKSSSRGRVHSTLKHDLCAAIQQDPRDAQLHNALGVVTVPINAAEGDSVGIVQAANAFQEAWKCDPCHVVAGLNLAEVLVRLGQLPHADEQARRVLAMLNQLAPVALELDAPLLPGDDELHSEWERAAWMNAGDRENESTAKVKILRWRLHRLLARLHGDVEHALIAHSYQPESASAQIEVGCALARKGRVHDAIPFVQQALQTNPMDNDAARVLFDLLGRAGYSADGDRLIDERRRLHERHPNVVPLEAWFIAPSAVASSLSSSPLNIVWHGSQEALHSLAHVNRELCARLAERGHQISLLPAKSPDPPGTRVELPQILRASTSRPTAGENVIHVSHQWPPDLVPPTEGHWVIIQPWEFGSAPKVWIEPMSRFVDEVWVPSRHVRDGYIRSGIPADRVHVVPNGVSDLYLRGDRAPLPMQTTKRFKFLFVGGTIERKGIDLLLKAYGQVFCGQDDVCLVIKDMGAGTFYQGQTAEHLIAQFKQIANAPDIEYLSQELSIEEMASLYAACDCLVHPYRGEGFGLPIAEAMACGLPVIVTGAGAARDFCSDDRAFLIPVTIVQFRDKHVGDIETVDRPWLAEPDQDALRYLLRYVIEHPEQAKAKAQRAKEYIAANLTWDLCATIAEARLQDLRKQPIRRLNQRYEPAAAPTYAITVRPKVTLTMIVKNEESNLPACLSSVADLVDEIVIVDTGSADRTKEIAIGHGAKLFDFPWNDSFSAARNESLKHATGEWVFWMDADDRIDAENRTKLRQFFANLPNENVGFVMKCLCLPDADTGTSTVVDHIRLFRNHPGHRWTYRIHEQILPSIRRQGGDVRWSDVVINHVGYQDSKVRKRKLQRDLRLLSMEYEEQPNDPFTLFNLASVYQEQGRVAESLDLFQRSLQRSAPEDSIVRKLYAQIIQCHRNLGAFLDALETCKQARSHYPDDLEILFQEALARRDTGDRKGAIACLEHLLSHRESNHFASIDTGLRGYKTRHNLAVFLQEEGHIDDADREWQLALVEQPDFRPAICGRAEIALTRRDWKLFDSMLTKLGAGKGDLELLTLTARKKLALREFTEARTTISQAIAISPNAVWPRVVLTHILLQEGVDWSAAEQALRDVLKFEPNHAESKRNLEVLLNRRRTQS